MEAYLARVSYHPEGTFGVFLWQEAPLQPLRPVATTCEEIWAFNQRNASCIPPGRYRCERWNSPKFGPTWQITGVPGRDLILLHPGNTTLDTEGCILLGETFTTVNGRMAIGESRVAFNEFLSLTADLEFFWLTVQDRTAG